MCLKKYLFNLILVIIFGIGILTIIRAQFETLFDKATSFPLNQYRFTIGMILTTLSGALALFYNFFLVKKKFS